MSLEVRTRDATTDSLRRLRHAYGMFPVHDERVENDPDYFQHGREKAEDGWLGSAGVWVSDADDRVVLIRHPKAPDAWGVPGGGHEPDETLSETAHRQVREETGLHCRLTDVLGVRRKEISTETDSDERIFALFVLFSGVCVGGELEVGDDVLDAQWFDSRPDDVLDFIEPQVQRWWW
ncbi:NUDIX domain-containing protein [Haladaptatus sp. R4]|uniref:NUDIX hydrolase n=1 Tax=Haladaptatus sp. R4 TaxID=1679489 RepID=UPI0007B47A47|nr:NUDIX domain-containing protein [Haladaptatus sp. R4]KZN26434.1 NUDIX domain-containing protein [Haladaptatus sp. R4]